MYQKRFKVNDVVVIGRTDGVPVFGRIFFKHDDATCRLHIMKTNSFNQTRHSYEVSESDETATIHPTNFLINDTMRIYFDKYVRLPYALPL